MIKVTPTPGNKIIDALQQTYHILEGVYHSSSASAYKMDIALCLDTLESVIAGIDENKTSGNGHEED